MTKTYGIDIAYKLDPDGTDFHLDDEINCRLGRAPDSGFGFGLRDMQWHQKPAVLVDDTVNYLVELSQTQKDIAYICMYEESELQQRLLEPNKSEAEWTKLEADLDANGGIENDPIFQYESDWYKAESRSKK